MSLINEQVTTIQLQNSCKFCLQVKPQIFPLAAKVQFQNIKVSPTSIAEVLQKVAPHVKMPNDAQTASLGICNSCFNELSLAYLFILKCEQAQVILEELLRQKEVPVEKPREREPEKQKVVAVEKNASPKKKPNKAVKQRRILPKPEKKCIPEKEMISVKQKDPISEEQPEILTEKQEIILDKIKTQEGALRSDTESSSPPPSPPRTRLQKQMIDKNCREYPCPICIKQFDALSLRKHVHTHKSLKKYLSIPEQYKIGPIAKFSSDRYQNKERMTIFERANRTHICPYCNLEFSTEEFCLHTDVHYSQTEFECEKCQRVFKRLNHLNTHKLFHLKEQTYNCPECDKGFVIKKNFDYHMLTHTNSQKPFDCKSCPLRFYNPTHLARHRLVHTEKITYNRKYRVIRRKCDRCQLSFADSVQLKNHVCRIVRRNRKIRQKSKKQQIKPNKTGLCTICGAYVSDLKLHKLKAHFVKKFARKKSLYNCKHCDKRFFDLDQFNEHLVVHDKAKPLVCGICGQIFNNVLKLQVHERVHEGIRPHVCVVCKKSFLEESYMKKHIRATHNVEEFMNSCPDNDNGSFF